MLMAFIFGIALVRTWAGGTSHGAVAVTSGWHARLQIVGLVVSMHLVCRHSHRVAGAARTHDEALSLNVVPESDEAGPADADAKPTVPDAALPQPAAAPA